MMLKQLARASGKTQGKVVQSLIRAAYKTVLPRLRVGAGFGFDAALVSRRPAAAKKVIAPMNLVAEKKAATARKSILAKKPGAPKKGSAARKPVAAKRSLALGRPPKKR